MLLFLAFLAGVFIGALVFYIGWSAGFAKGRAVGAREVAKIAIDGMSDIAGLVNRKIAVSVAGRNIEAGSAVVNLPDGTVGPASAPAAEHRS